MKYGGKSPVTDELLWMVIGSSEGIDKAGEAG